MCMLRSHNNFEYRFPLSAHSLTTDSSVITAIANDIGYEFIFSRQLEALAQTKDLLIGLSTSGNSANVIKAFELTKKEAFNPLLLPAEAAIRPVAKLPA